MTIFTTLRRENLESKIKRILFNLFPSYRRGGGRVIFFSSDMKEIHVKVSLNWQTRNYVGSVFGGSLYAAVDPMYMIQLVWILGKNYIVWDKSASLKFIRPVKTTVYGKFEISDELINTIKSEVASNGSYVIDCPIILQDTNGDVYYTGSKQVYIASREYYKKRQEEKKKFPSNKK